MNRSRDSRGREFIRGNKKAGTKVPTTIRITEIYPAILGESDWAGWPGLIVRLTGCNLRCSWCDTAFAFTGGRERTVAKVVAAAQKAGRPRVLVTGGEPLCQPGAPPLLAALLDAGFRVMLETNGSVDIAAAPKAVHVVMDLKAPDSGSSAANRFENLDRLKPTDEIKIVIASRGDYVWARRQVRERGLAERFRVSLSPAAGRVEPADLAGWMLADRLEARLGLQLHKVLFGNRRRT